MKKIGQAFIIGCGVALLGLIFADLCATVFNGIEFGSACVLGMSIFLCIVIVTCTGVILSALDSKKSDDSTDKEKDE